MSLLLCCLAGGAHALSGRSRSVATPDTYKSIPICEEGRKEQGKETKRIYSTVSHVSLWHSVESQARQDSLSRAASIPRSQKPKHRSLSYVLGRRGGQNGEREKCNVAFVGEMVLVLVLVFVVVVLLMLELV